MKSADAFRTISEVSELLDAPAHVLRFWESRFTQIRPIKRAGGRRYYRPADVTLLAGIKRLLHDDGLTIRGVQKILRERGVAHVSALASQTVINAVGLGAPAAEVLSDVAAHPLPGAVLPKDGQGLPGFDGESGDATDAGAFPMAVPAGTGTGPTAAPPELEQVSARTLPLWPEGETPDTPGADSRLLPDPEEDEAPIDIDVPTLPHRGHAMVTAIGRAQGRGPVSATGQDLPVEDASSDHNAPEAVATAPLPEADATEAAPGAGPDTSLIDDDPLPAARMLRAMTALRARDHRDELLAIYRRAHQLHGRLSESTEPPPTAD